MKYISIYILLVACIIACGCTTETVIRDTRPNKTYVSGNNMSVIFIDVEQGDSILIVYNNTATLIDAGKVEYGETVLEYLDTYGVDRLDYVVMTHEHTDHFGGLQVVLDKYEVDNFVYSTCDSKFCNVQIINKAEGAQRIRARSGTILEIDPDVDMRVLSPPEGGMSDVNDGSVVVRLAYGDTSFLFMGDAERGAEEYMLDTYTWELDVDVLKIGHHGSDGSITQEFLQETTPKIAVISVGENNQYGHPSQSTLRILSKVPIMRTDIEGTIVIETDGKKIRI